MSYVAKWEPTITYQTTGATANGTLEATWRRMAGTFCGTVTAVPPTPDGRWPGEGREAPHRSGRWLVRRRVGSEPAPGPLIEVEGRAVSVDATLQSDEGEEERQAEIRAECPA